jgi:hypothetical protein
MYVNGGTVGALKKLLAQFPDDMEVTNREGGTVNEVEKETFTSYANDADEDGTDREAVMLGFVGD